MPYQELAPIQPMVAVDSTPYSMKVELVAVQQLAIRLQILFSSITCKALMALFAMKQARIKLVTKIPQLVQKVGQHHRISFANKLTVLRCFYVTFISLSLEGPTLSYDLYIHHKPRFGLNFIYSIFRLSECHL